MTTAAATPIEGDRIRYRRSFIRRTLGAEFAERIGTVQAPRTMPRYAGPTLVRVTWDDEPERTQACLASVVEVVR